MADFFKGLAGGFQTGLQFGEQLRKRRMEEELAQVYAKPETSQGYTAEDAQRMEEYANSGMYDIVPQYAPGTDGQAQGIFTGYQAVPKAGVDAPGATPLAPVSFKQQQVQDYGGRRVAGQFDPTQLRGIQMREAAGVLGRYGDVRGAAALEAQAEEQAYQARIRPLQEEQLKQQGLLTAGKIREMNKTQERETKLEAVDADVAKWQSSRLIDPNTNEPRQPTMDDNIAALQYRATALQKAGLAKEATESLRDYQGFAVNQITLDEKQRNAQLAPVAAAIAAGDLGPAAAFYDRYVLDGAKVTGMKTDPKSGAITVSRVRDDGTALPDKVIKGGANELLAALNSFKDPMSLYNFSQNEFKNNLDLRKTVSAEKAADATVGLRNAQIDQIKAAEKNADERVEVSRKFAELTPEEQAGPKGQGLIKQFNLLNVKAGGQVSIGPAPKAAGPEKLSDLDKLNLKRYYDWVDDPKNAKLPPGAKDKKANELGVTQFINRAAQGPAQGMGSNPY